MSTMYAQYFLFLIPGLLCKSPIQWIYSIYSPIKNFTKPHKSRAWFGRVLRENGTIINTSIQQEITGKIFCLTWGCLIYLTETWAHPWTEVGIKLSSIRTNIVWWNGMKGRKTIQSIQTVCESHKYLLREIQEQIEKESLGTFLEMRFPCSPDATRPSERVDFSR